MDIQARCRKEVAELHEFFQQWFKGDLPDTDEAFERFPSVINESFHIVSPSGRITPAEQIIPAVRSAHNSGEILIWIDNHTHMMTLGDVALVTFEESQSRDDDTRVLFSSALLREKEGTLNGLEWLHVHETWMPGDEEEEDIVEQ